MEERLEMSAMMSPARRNRQRALFIGLVLVFFSPMIAAWIAYGYMQGESGATSKRNHGELLTPARPLADFTLHRVDAGPYRLADMRGKWTLVYFGGQDCDSTCRHALYVLQQSRLAQGGEMKRVERVYIAAMGTADTAMRGMLKSYPGTTVLTGSAGEVDDLAQQFAAPATDGWHVTGSMYIVDPLGNVVMHYAPGFSPRGLVKDMELLLKVSQIG